MVDDADVGYMNPTLYDKSGRLRQMENAKKSASLYSVCIAIKYKDGIILGARRFTNAKEEEKDGDLDFIDAEQVGRIYEVDRHIVVTYAGLQMDARDVIKNARTYCSRYREGHNENITLGQFVNDIGEYENLYTRQAGLRSLGISMIIAGIDDDGSVRLYKNEPNGEFWVYRTAAYSGEMLSGENKDMKREINKLLASEHRADMEYNDARKLLVKCLMKTYTVDVDKPTMSKRMEVGVLKKDVNVVKFEKLPPKELEDCLFEAERELAGKRRVGSL